MTTTPERSATLTELVAAQIRSLLGYRDMRPSELARRIGENDQWMHVRLKGKVPLNLNDMHRIARALDVPVGQLMPPPEVAAGAANPSAIPRYLQPPDRIETHTDRPRDNRPAGKPGSGHSAGGVRTSYVSRRPRGRQD